MDQPLPVVQRPAAADRLAAAGDRDSSQTSFESTVPWVKGWPSFSVRITTSSSTSGRAAAMEPRAVRGRQRGIDRVPFMDAENIDAGRAVEIILGGIFATSGRPRSQAMAVLAAGKRWSWMLSSCDAGEESRPRNRSTPPAACGRPRSSLWLPRDSRSSARPWPETPLSK